MPCSITIGIPSGQETDGTLSVLTVTGTADGDCTTVRVTVKQTTPELVLTPPRDGTVTNGQWSVDFSVAGGDFQPGNFRCGADNKYVINVVCVDDECTQQLSREIINCDGCPEVAVTATPGDCIGGRRAVQFSADVVSAGDATYLWRFGVDEDGQPGEDSQPGDGNGFLPPPDPVTGVRTVTTQHLYDATGSEARTITMRLVTASGPDSQCETSHSFTLEPCPCPLTVNVALIEDPRDSATDCLPPGDYLAAASTTPSDANTVFVWSLDGTPAPDQPTTGQATSTFPFTLAVGEEKTISVAAIQGRCVASDALPVVRACTDCSGFTAELTVRDVQGTDVTERECLPSGSIYTVEVGPLPGNVTYQWRRGNVVDPTVEDNRYPVQLGDGDELVTVEASSGDCRDVASTVLRPCRPPSDDVSLTCLLFKILALLGLGLATLGAVLIFCPGVAAGLLPPDIAIEVGILLLIGGLALLALGFTLWLLICRPDGCDWQVIGWQALILVGLVLIYAGFCPACRWMLLGLLPLGAGIGLFFFWQSDCNPTRCRVIIELISLLTFVVNVVAILEAILAWCVITSAPILAALWAIIIALLQWGLWDQAFRNNCLRDLE